MKTLILTLVLIFGLAASNHGKPLNEIYSIKDPVFTEEAYINDIPFDTYEIAVGAILDGDEVKLEEEAYADDIPFDTRSIACKALLRRMLETTGEVNVNDIPFSTEKVLCEQLAAELTAEYRNEKNVEDLPEEPDLIICSFDRAKSSYEMVRIKMPKKITLRKGKTYNPDFTIIYPAKLEIPRFEIEKEGTDKELLAIPGFSL
jgi:hypothetical protein